MRGTLLMAKGLARTMDTQELCGVSTVTVSFVPTKTPVYIVRLLHVN